MDENLEIIKQILMDDLSILSVLIEMRTKYKNKEYGDILVKYEAGKITCIKNSKNVKL